MNPLILIILPAALAACSDDSSGGADTGGTDTGEADGGDLDVAQETGDVTPDVIQPPAECWHSQSTSNLTSEPGGGDWADCIDGCTNDSGSIPIFNLTQMSTDGWSGRIDGQTHEFGAFTGGAGDLDWVGVILPPRTLATFYVDPAAGSDFSAVITTHDGTNGGGMTFSGGFAEGATSARTQVAQPYVNDLPFYFIIDHASYYENRGSSFAPDGDHPYVVRIETTDFSATDLGTAEAGTPLTGSGTIACPGDIAYFEFVTSGGLPSLTVTRTGGDAFVLLVQGMDTTGGQLIWGGGTFDGSSADPDGSANGVVSLPSQSFAQDSGEYIFAVTDYNGRAGPGTFTFDVEITAN